VYRKGKLAASHDPQNVGIGSRLTCDLIAGCYDEYLATYARGRLIDLGCVKVPLYASYKDFVSEVVCVDWGNTAHRTNHLDQECDLTKPLPFRDGEFDTVILSDVLEHISQPMLLWGEIARLLAKKGNVLMSVPFYYWLHEEPYDFFRYTEHALRWLAEGAGLRVVLLKSYGGAPEILADITAKNALRIPKIGTTVSTLVQELVSRFRTLAIGRTASESTSKQFPLGYFLVAEKPADPER
jgi:SAM-dependent methyltransferase